MGKNLFISCLFLCTVLIFTSCKTTTETTAPAETDPFIRTGSTTQTGSIHMILGAFIQGHTDSATTRQIPHTVNIYLASPTSPYAFVDSAIGISLTNTGMGQADFYNISGGSAYYVVVKSSNTIETWSSSPVTITTPSFAWDFRTLQNRAYGNNMIKVGLRWAIYSGDVVPNQDGIVDYSDMQEISNNLGLTGVRPSDLNGDQIVDSLDAALADRNSSNYVMISRP